MQTGAASHFYFLIISTILPLGQIYHRYVMNAKLIILFDRHDQKIIKQIFKKKKKSKKTLIQVQALHKTYKL